MNWDKVSGIPQNRLYQTEFIPFAKLDLQQCIPTIFERRVGLHPDGLAVRTHENSISYRSLNDIANQIAHAILKARGEGEEPIALLLGQGAMLVASILGVLKSAKIYVALDPSYSPEELGRIVDDCRPGLIVTEAAHRICAAGLASAKDRCLVLEDIATAAPKDNPSLGLGSDKIAYIYYTSGSTGAPKGVADSHRNVLHNVMRYTNNLGIDRNDRLSMVQSCAFSGTVSSLFSALLNGAAIFPFDLQDRGIGPMADWLNDEEITIFHSVPVIFEQLLGTGRDFPHLRIIRLEGDQADRRHVALFKARFDHRCVLVNGLGTTETGIIRQFFIDPATDIPGAAVPVGGAVEDMDIRLVDEKGRQVAAGQVGEIAVASRYLARGYWRRPDLTATNFVPHPDDPENRVYHTGDIGRMLPGACLEYLGRKDFQVKIRGLRLEVAEIENALDGLAEVDSAMVLAREDRPGVQQLVAYLTSAATPRPTVSFIRRKLAERFPEMMIPARYVFLEQLPGDRNRKLARQALPPPDRKRPPLDQPFVEPHSPTARTIAACFGAVLALDGIGLHDDFFDLGGDSLLATELLLLLEEKLGVLCPPDFLFEGPNVHHIQRRLEEDAKAGPIVPIQGQGAWPPLFCLHSQSGQVLEYRHLGRLLRAERSVFGVQSLAMIRGDRRIPPVESMASTYVSEIRSLQPDGPYYLCGNCFGGTLAFEVARQLRSQGQEVALLALIDSAYPEGALRRLPVRLAVAQQWRRQKDLPLGDRIRYFAQRLRGLSRWDPEIRYRPKPYDGKVVLICAGRPHNQLGWNKVARLGLTIVQLPPFDESDETPHLTREPYVQGLARALSEQLKAAAESHEHRRVPTCGSTQSS